MTLKQCKEALIKSLILVVGVVAAMPQTNAQMTMSECQAQYYANMNGINAWHQAEYDKADLNFDVCLAPFINARDNSIATAQLQADTAIAIADTAYSGALVACGAQLIIALAAAAALPDPGIAEALAFANHAACMATAWATYQTAYLSIQTALALSLVDIWATYETGRSSCLASYEDDLDEADEQKALLDALNNLWRSNCELTAPDNPSN